MRISDVLKKDSGTVVCLENNATITVATSKGVKTFTSTFPKGSPAMSEESFKSLYKHKHFKPTETASTSKSKSE